MGGRFLEVAAAAILSANRESVLLTLRHANAHQGGLWEFPGGKIESTENRLDALCRELREELNINAKRAEPLITIEHSYSDKSVRLHVFTVLEFAGTPKAMESQAMQWFSLSDLPNLDFPEANKPIVDKLLADLL